MRRLSVRCSSVVIALFLSLGSTEAPGDYQQFTFSEEIDFVLVDNGPTVLAGFGVGTTVHGTLRYGADESDAVVTPQGDNETDYLFLGFPYGTTLHSTTPVISIDDATVVASDHTWAHEPGLAELSQILGIAIQDGDPFDGWTVRSEEHPVNGIALGVAFFAFTNTDLLGDQDYRAEPPAGIGNGGFDGAVFLVLETNASGDVIFEGLGRVDSYTVTLVPEPAMLALLGMCAAFALRRRR